ncbi:MAG: FxsA family protein [Geminicoccaceae bacterium]|nr:FxsA family protein [Geminicoccaceae bacterium]
MLLIAFIGVPLLEIAIFIQVGGVIGLGWTLALVVLTAIAGTILLRQQGFQVLRRAQAQIDAGNAPVREVFEGVCLLFAGALLLTPGFFTDVVGGSFLLPPVRALLFQQVRRRIEAELARRGRQPGPSRGGEVIDAEFHEVDGEGDMPVEGEPKGAMPPPRGGWGRDS